MERELWNGVEAGSDSDFTGLLAVHCEMRQVWTGSRSPAQLVGVPAVIICSVPALFLPSLDSWIPSSPSVHNPAAGVPLEPLLRQVLPRSYGSGTPEGRTQGELTLTRKSSVQQSEWGEFIKEQMENCVCVCYDALK